VRRAQGRGLESLTLPPPRPSEILRSVFRILRARPLHIIGLAALVFGTTAVIQAFVEAKVVDGSFSDEIEMLARVTVALIGAFGFVFYAGLLDLVVGAHHRGEPDPTVREVIHQLPHGKLVVADAILVTVCGLLALLFVIPGIIALTFFCLIGPVIVTEQHTVIDAFRRSARLVRPHFWMVLFMVVVPLIFEDLVLHAFNLDLIHYSVIDEFLVNAAIGAAIGSVVGLLEVVLAHEFRARDPLPEVVAAVTTNA
jgi:hypothetical protein